MGFAKLAHAQLSNMLLLLLSMVCCSAVASGGQPSLAKRSLLHYEHDSSGAVDSSEDTRLHVFTLDYDYVQIPYEVTLWILLASFAKIGFHIFHRLPRLMPESCILIAIGALVGAIIFASHHKSPPVMDSSIYFLYLLPPIILEEGYFMPTRPFFENFGSILWWSLLGSLLNSFGIGLSLYGICQIEAFGLSDLNLLQNLLFGSMISAVDPVAALVVFEEASVNEQLYMMIFGESLLNDGITVVLYNIFIAFTQMHRYEEIESIDVFAGFARFFVVGLGGVLFGIVFGFISAFMTRFTHNVSSIEPLLVFMFSYLSYLSAETLYISGILAMTACAVTMKKYVEENVSQNSYTTIKYFMKMLSSISETLIFVFMGVSTVGKNHEWNWAFICFTLFFCLIWRTLSVFALFYISNKFRTYPFTFKDQLIISYSGLRGASSFSLAFLLPVNLFPRKNLFITATIVVIYFTVFIQGITIGPLVKYLDVKKTNKKESINEEIHVRLMDHLKAGIEDICGHWSHYQLRDKFKKFDNKYLKKILIREHQPKSSLVSLYKKMEIKLAIEMAESGMKISKPSTTSLQSGRDQRTQRLSPAEVEAMRDVLAHNLYQVRQRAPAYNRHNLPTDTSEKQAQEILIRREHSLRQSCRKGNSLPWGRPVNTTEVRYLSLPQGPRQPTRTKARHVTFTGNGSALLRVLLQQQKKLGQLFGGFNSTTCTFPWKWETASLNELHPSLILLTKNENKIYVVNMISTAAVSVLFQNLLLFSFSLLNKYSCDPCSSTWPSSRTQISHSPQPHRQSRMQNYYVAHPGETDGDPCPQFLQVPRLGIPNRQPHIQIQCMSTHSQTQRAAQTWHRAHTNANNTDGLILVPSLADETDRLLVKNYKCTLAI